MAGGNAETEKPAVSRRRQLPRERNFAPECRRTAAPGSAHPSRYGCKRRAEPSELQLTGNTGVFPTAGNGGLDAIASGPIRLLAWLLYLPDGTEWRLDGVYEPTGGNVAAGAGFILGR